MTATAMTGVLLAVAAAIGSWARDWLTLPGAAVAACLGAAVIQWGGPAWGATLGIVFAVTAALSAGKHRPPGAEGRAGGELRRSAAQVVGSGLLPAAVAVAHALAGEPPVTVYAFAGGLATVAGDTWASDLWEDPASEVRLITSGRPVPAGTPGGVSLRGFGLVVVASLLVGVTLWGSVRLMDLAGSAGGPARPPLLVGGALAGGLLGATVDSCLRAGWTETLPSEVANVLSSTVGAAAGALLGLAAG